MSINKDVLQALAVLEKDLSRLEKLRRYRDGEHDPPYMPDSAGNEYRMLAERSVTNWLGLVIDATAQALIVDNFRRHNEDDFDSPGDDGGANTSPDWAHWQASRMDAAQQAIIRAALAFGHSFILTEKRNGDGRPISRGLSPMRTVTMYEDPANDTDPAQALYVRRWSSGDKPGILWFWDEKHFYVFHFDQHKKLVQKSKVEHGAKRCPVTRVSVYVDLEGNTTGLVEPLIPVQDRLNQSVFDLLVAQSYTSFEVRTVTGQAPPIKMERKEDGTYGPALDENGDPVPDAVVINAARWMYAESEDVRFGHLPAGELKQIIEAIELGQRHLSAIAQVPPHYMLGQISNVNAEGLNAAAVQLARKNGEIAISFGESFERMFRVAAEMRGENIDEDDFGETIWRDLNNASIAQVADALGKFATNLGIPHRGLWSRVPNVTRTELNQWERLYEQEHPHVTGEPRLTDEDFDLVDNGEDVYADSDALTGSGSI